MLEKRLENLEHAIAFTKHQARLRSEQVYRQRTLQRKLEGERYQVMACIAIKEICLNKSDLGDDVLRMIKDFALS